jgi:DNA-nicking Smr family endonuclease
MGKKGSPVSPGFNTPFQGLKPLAPKPAGAAKAEGAKPAGAKPPGAKDPKAAPSPAVSNAPVPPKVPAARSPAPQKAPAPTQGSADDDRFFVQAMRGVKPLGEAERGRRPSPLGAPPPSAPARRRAPLRNDDADAEAELAELVSGGRRPERAPEVDRRLARHLRDGDYPIEARLDLHGHSRDEATGALERFILQSMAAARRCVLVIHGRGLNSGDAGPVLGEAVQRVLTVGRVAPAILAFTHAAPAHGGDGATLVLLRKRREPKNEAKKEPAGAP